MCCANSLNSASTYAAWCRKLTSIHCWCWIWAKAPRRWIVWWCQPPQEVGMQLGDPKYPYRYKHLVIVHGIGDQVPNETSLNFMNQFLRALPRGQGFELQVDNLIESVDDVRTQSPGNPDPPPPPGFVVFASTAAKCNLVIVFTEVY